MTLLVIINSRKKFENLKVEFMLGLQYKVFIYKSLFLPFWKFACLFILHLPLDKKTKKILRESVSGVLRIVVRRSSVLFSHIQHDEVDLGNSYGVWFYFFIFFCFLSLLSLALLSEPCIATVFCLPNFTVYSNVFSFPRIEV